MIKKMIILILLCLHIGSSLCAMESGKDAAMAGTGDKHSEWVPEWAKRAVWYQIFPERFRNGDTQNDPEVGDIKGSWPHDYTSPWQVHPWTSDWYELQPWERKNGKDVWFNIQRRRYGGDIQGIIDKLPYLEDLGVNALYLNPVFMAPSLHKYDAAVYHHIDPNFGPDPEGDKKLIAAEKPDDPGSWEFTSADRLMLKLIAEAHSRKMHIIFDGVFNHIGLNNPFFQDVVINQKGSPYRDWFVIKSWDDSLAGTKFDYEGWFGVRELPEWREDDNGIVRGPKKYIFDITRRWMDPDGDGNPGDGIDGWRLDVAFCVKHPFWKDWGRLVRSINPEAYLTAEIIDTVEANCPYLEGDEFSAVMNYNFAFATHEFFIAKKKTTVTDFDSKLRKLRDAYDHSVAYVMQNLLDSHDTARVATHIVNSGAEIPMREWKKYSDLSRTDKGLYDTRKPAPQELRVQKLLAIFQMTYLGAPMIYYGDEAGMWGANDPCCRKPMVWDDLTYSDEVYLPGGSKKTTPDKVEFSRDLFEFYRKLIKIRKSHQALETGDFSPALIDDSGGLYAFTRCQGESLVIVIINNGTVTRKCVLKAPVEGAYVDEMNQGEIFKTAEGQSISLDVEPGWGRILAHMPGK